MKVIITSLYGDPLHEGHLDYFEEAKKLAGDGQHWVIVNNNKQALLKKGFYFLDETLRKRQISKSRDVNGVFLSVDKDLSVCETLMAIVQTKKHPEVDFYFLNSGDSHQIREQETCDKLGVKVLFLSLPKRNSSTDILRSYEDYLKKIERL